MKRNLLTLGLLAVSFSLNAQFLTYVGQEGNVSVKEGALYYNGGGINVVQSGSVDVNGDVLVSGNITDKFVTAGAQHFILRLNTPDSYGTSKYGQLRIDGVSQDNITGIVDKEYRDQSHGQYQQMALPFYAKLLGDLNTEIPNIGLTDVRFIGSKASGTNVLYHDNQRMVSHLKKTTESTSESTEYYIIGTKNLASDYFPNNTSTIKGKPFADGIAKTLSGAAANVSFNGGNGLNQYGQQYKNYVTDAWDLTQAGEKFTGQFGKDIYQFGNPHLTNLDLSLLSSDVKSKIKGIRYAIDNTSTNLANEANSNGYYINFTSGGTTAVGDVDAAIIKPMQTFIVKLTPNGSTNIDFSSLRTFDYTAKNSSAVHEGKGSYRKSGKASASQTESVKQLDVIALDANKNEIARTYYVVYPGATTGYHEGYSVQVAADNANIIGTFEENANGGIDSEAQNKYWLYINEANEVDFKGKKVPMYLYPTETKKIAYLKFVVREDAKKLGENQSLSSGESFYVSAGNKSAQKISQDYTIPVTSRAFGLYYGNPENATLANEETNVTKPSATILVLDSNDNEYKIIFDKNWKTADVQIFDISGRLVNSQKNVKADTPYTLDLPKGVQSTFVVVATSESGQKFSQKVKTN